jgi:salicylate hydroxylase
MPPQGESTGLAIEDAILFARIISERSSLSSPQEVDIETLFKVYINTRSPRINAAYDEATARWENVRDKSWFEQKIVEIFTSIWLWWKRDTLEQNFAYDVRNVKLK